MIYIVVPHYIITEELEELATNALKSMQHDDVFLVSVNDGSPRDVTFLDELSGKVLHLDTNSGFAKASNTGLRWAIEQDDAEYVGCANNDIEVRQDWLDALTYPFKAFDNVGITGLVASKDRAEVARHYGNTITHGGLINDKMQSGGLWLSTKEVLGHVGLFDEQFEVGGEEDVDLFLRMRDTYDYLIVMSNMSMFWHKEGATRWNEEVEGLKEFNKQAEEKNYDRFAKKWGFDIRAHGLRFYEEVLENNGIINTDYARRTDKTTTRTEHIPGRASDGNTSATT